MTRTRQAEAITGLAYQAFARVVASLEWRPGLTYNLVDTAGDQDS